MIRIAAATFAMLACITAAMAYDDRTPDWRTAKAPVPRRWTDRDMSDFEERVHGDPVWHMRQQVIERNRWHHHPYRYNRYYQYSQPYYYLDYEYYYYPYGY